ncbi:MAG: ribosome biogenesis GTPase Der [Verrucomicrobiota bacterium]|nr:ribosome biogenesis GTPase Der [Verrucomicrobiota bacterium]
MPERIVAIVGRPNVGKSALFNRLAGRRISIVHDMPGVTRDRIHAECQLGNEPFTIVDTGGIGGAVDADFTEQVHLEVEIAIAAAQVILFVVDGQEGLTPVDHELARRLRKVDKPLLLAINKIDHEKHGPNTAEFSRLGFENQISISAEHDLGIQPLVAWLERLLPPPDHRQEEDRSAARPVKIAIVGRPNVGKSSLANAVLRDKRTLVSPIAGTTRDAVDIPYTRGDQRYLLVDTAGIRPRGKVSTSVEVFSVMRSETSIKRADLCCLVVDASAGVTAQDKKIAGLIQQAKKPCVVAVNKCDLIKDQTAGKASLKKVLDDIRAELFFIDYAPLILCSAKASVEIPRLFKMIEKVRAASRQRIGTGPLNRLLQAALTAHAPPIRSGRRFKLLYATQPESPPEAVIAVPEIVFFVNDGKLLVESYERFLAARIREEMPYTGLPLLFHFRARKPAPG